MAIQLPKRLHPDFIERNKQPLGPVEVDYGSSYVSGIKELCWLSEQPRDLVRGKNFAVTGATVTKRDNYVAHEFVTSDVIRTGITETPGDQYTLTCIARYTGSASTSTEKTLYSNIDNSGGTFTNGSFTDPNGDVESGTFFIVTVTYDYPQNEVRYYVNGVDAGNTTTPYAVVEATMIRYNPAANTFEFFVASSASMQGEFTIGYTDVLVADYWEGDIAMCMRHNRAMEHGEIMEMHRDIFYHLLRPAVPMFYFKPGAGGAFTLPADSGAYTYSGTDAALEFGASVSADSGSYTYTGTNADLNRGYPLTAGSGTYTYSGTDAALTFAGAGAFTLEADSGSYSYSGTAAGLEAAFVLSADSGSYSYSGTNADLNRGYPLPADSGSYTYSGTTVALTAGLVLSADSGTYTYTGTNVILTASGQVWTIQTDSVDTWSVQSNSSDTWTIQADSSDTWTIE